MFCRLKRRWIACACAALLAGGCRSSQEKAVEAPATPATAPANAVSETPAPATTEPAPSAPAGAPGAAPKVVATHSFTPPFPNRLDLFAPPKRALGTVRKEEEVGAKVELKGFVNVNGPRVVLSIDGVIALIPEGGEKYGVQVISIDPPSVVLQRGRTRWPAKLD